MAESLPEGIKEFYAILGLFTMDFSFGVPGCGTNEPVTFVQIFELNMLLLVLSVMPVVIFMPLTMLFFGYLHAAAVHEREEEADAPAAVNTVRCRTCPYTY